jgi:hypothetical protein
MAHRSLPTMLLTLNLGAHYLFSKDEMSLFTNNNSFKK